MRHHLRLYQDQRRLPDLSVVRWPPPGRGEGGEVFGAKTPPPVTPSRNVGAFRLQHRRGIAIPGPFGAANRAAFSKQARFIRRWRRFACFPHTPLKRLKGVGLRPLPFGYPSRNRTGERVAKRLRPQARIGANRPLGRLLGGDKRGARRGQIRRPPRKRLPRPQMRVTTIPVPQRYSAPGRNLPSFHRAVSHDPRTCPNLSEWAGFGHKARFSSTVHGAFFFGKRKKNGGCIPRPAPVARPPRPGHVGRYPLSPVWGQTQLRS